MHKRVGVVFLLLVVAAATLAVLSPGRSTEVAAVSNDGIAPGDAGMRVFLDPETGETLAAPDPNAVIELDGELQNAMRRDTEGLPTIKHQNGAESIELDGRYQEASVVRIDENGKHIICTDRVENLEKALNEPSTTAEVQ
jgi:hypothetical protein